MEDLFPASWGTKEGLSAFLALAVSLEVSLILNNPYGKRTYFKVAYFVPFQD